MGPCKRVGSDGLACSQTDGCRWDWDLATCKPTTEPTNHGSSGCASAKTGKACKQIKGCIFDKGTKACVEESAGRKGGRTKKSKDTCAKLKGKRCSKNASCVLDGKVCRHKGDNGGGASCGQRSRKLCTGTCKFDKVSKICISA